jgi:transcriptional regulator with XRE-family HTH domain
MFLSRGQAHGDMTTDVATPEGRNEKIGINLVMIPLVMTRLPINSTDGLPMDDQERMTIGKNVRSNRLYRGMSLEALAGLAGISKGFLSMVENGQRSLNNRHHVAAIADALKVSVTDITGEPYEPKTTDEKESHAGIAVMRNVLIRRSLDFPERTGYRPLSTLSNITSHVTQLRSAANYAEMARVLPALLNELHEAFLTDSDRITAGELLSLALGDAYVYAKVLGYHELAWIAVERGRDVAEKLEDPLWLALADWRRANVLHALGGFARAEAVSVRAADDIIAQHPTGQGLELYGMLHLYAAVSAAERGNFADGIAHIDEAADVAQRTGEAHSYALWFGPTNVGIWRMGYAVIAGDGGEVREIARSVNPRLIPSRTRQAGYYMELGRGLANTRKNDHAAITAFRQAEDLAGPYVRSNPFVRDAVTTMSARIRRDALGRELRGLAHRMRISL